MATPTHPNPISANVVYPIDVDMAIARSDGRRAAEAVRIAVRNQKAMDERIVLWQFAGERQRGAPVVDVLNAFR